MQQIANLNLAVNGQGAGLAYLESLGYSPEDAALALSVISYLNTCASVYFGTATQTPAYNFNQQLSPRSGPGRSARDLAVPAPLRHLQPGPPASPGGKDERGDRSQRAGVDDRHAPRAPRPADRRPGQGPVPPHG